jgi:putative heme-binding domain-containing protein
MIGAVLFFAIVLASSSRIGFAENEPAQNGKENALANSQIFARKNLVAWCIVPFDGKKRGPAERAAMCAKLGLRKIAYDWRDEHVATFEQEILEYKKHGLEYFAFWAEHDEAFRLFEKHKLHPQVWKMFAQPKATTQEARVKEAAAGLLPLVERTRKMGSKLGLYNHGGWAGEPENMVAVCEYLRKHHDASHVGIVYNMHHAHGRIDDFAELVELLKPYLLCLNLNGMTRNGDQRGRKILPLGEGEFDVSLLKIILSSGYSGPIGIIGHTQDDVEQRLQDNLDGLDWILPQLDGKPAGPKPKLRTWSPQVEAPRTPPSPRNVPAVKLDGEPGYRKPPLTVECRVTLPRKDQYNILVASDTKRSGAHWEIFSMNGSGNLTVYTPGRKPDHTDSKAMICDGKPHNIAMILLEDRIRLLVDGKVVADQKAESLGRETVPGGLTIAGLVEGGLGCSGPVEWVRISRGVRNEVATEAAAPAKDDSTLLLWENPKPVANAAPGGAGELSKDGAAPEYSRALIDELIAQAAEDGNAGRGLAAFAAAKSACLSCHKLGKHGGTVGPDLTKIGKERKPEEIVEAILWPKRTVKPEFKAHLIVTDQGQPHRGYIVRESKTEVVLRDPTKPAAEQQLTIPAESIDFRREVGTLMPDNLVASLNRGQLADVLRLLIHQGQPSGLPVSQIDSVLHHTMAHMSGPASFPYENKPLHPEHWPSWQHHVNRDRIYDFYGKQADHFRAVRTASKPVPPALIGYPGLDGGGDLGHWGNQDETTWASGDWSKSDRGTLMSGVFRGNGLTIPRGICVRVGDGREMACCFDPDTLLYKAAWKGGFVTTSSVRHGFIEGLRMEGTPVPWSVPKLDRKTKYKGLYRIGPRVVFAYEIDGKEYLDLPWHKDGNLVREVATRDEHSWGKIIDSGEFPSQWPEKLETKITHGTGSPYAVDTIELPVDNPWKALFFAAGQAFLPDGSALVCTMQGDVWKVSGIGYPSKKATWKRLASGLHHALGIVADKDGIFVLGRDQITRLHDRNGDGEADFYECFSNACQTSPAGHDYICGLVRDAEGYFYTASGNQGLVRISPDGQKAEVIATGFRNPDGLGLTADGRITVPCSEGGWTPASMICETDRSISEASQGIPHFGFRGPKNGEVPSLPLAYLPRGVDNSAGGQVNVTSDEWGPLRNQLLHLSFGTGSHFLVLRDRVDGQSQGAIVPLPGEFASGIHRGSFNPHDGQLYVTGMQGWGCYTPQAGCFQRVRYTGEPVQLPVGFEVYRNGILLRFSSPLDEFVTDPEAHFAQCWNYRYSQAYGSPEFSTKHQGMRGHDVLEIRSALHLDKRQHELFLEIPDIQPVNQLHLRLQLTQGHFQDLFITVHKLRDRDYEDASLTVTRNKTVNPHPILRDLAMATRVVPNPYARRIKGARSITIETGSNLSYKTRSFKVKAGESIALTLSNPDVVPHNLAIVKPGTLERVGRMANRLISDPDAAIRHYIPQTSDVLVYTDVVLSKEKFTIQFKAPETPGRYPYLCTFPGHWLIMNGEMIVE